MEHIRIQKGQVWKSKVSNMTLLIAGKHGSLWKTKQLTEKPGVYRNTHSMSEFILRRRYELCP